jgi:hypothetical protein
VEHTGEFTSPAIEVLDFAWIHDERLPEKLGLAPVLPVTLVRYIARTMRTEVKDFMRMCERLIGLALQTGELSAEECDIVSYYAKELHQTTHPLCEKHKCQTPVSSN